MTQLLLVDLPATGRKASKRKPASLDRIKVNHTIAKDRYYYHRRLDKTLFKIDGATRIIECDFKSLEDIPEGERPYGGHKAGQRHYIEQLVALGYNLQFKALVVPEQPEAVPVLDKLIQEYLSIKKNI